ncbi:MAG: MFS transporter [Chloroflexi bacterium]|nr:MFS transporter [Chloroflexota bacterium]
MAAIRSRIEEGNLTRFHWRIEVFGGLHLLVMSIDAGLIAFIYTQLVPEWHLSPWNVGVIGMLNAAGTLCGAILAGTAADRLGRKYVLRVYMFIAALGTILGAISWNYISLAVFQFFVGAGVGGVTPGVAILIGEFAPARFRGRLSAMMELFWVSGWMVAALGAFLIIPKWGWRGAFIFGGVSLLYAAIQNRFIPESPRYLMARGRTEEANRFLEMLRTRYGIIQDIANSPTSTARRGVLAGLKELWSGPLARRTACTWVLWFALVYTYFGIFIWIPTLLATSGFGAMRTFEFMFVFSVVQFPAVVFAAFLIDWVGRKWLVVSTLFVCGIASYFFGRAGSYPEVLFWGVLIAASNIIGWSVMLGYTAELFPTPLRGTGSGWASAFGRTGAIAVPGAIAFLLGTWETGYQMVFIMFAVILIAGALLMALLGEETKGRTLEEISAHV